MVQGLNAGVQWLSLATMRLVSRKKRLKSGGLLAGWVTRFYMTNVYFSCMCILFWHVAWGVCVCVWCTETCTCSVYVYTPYTFVYTPTCMVYFTWLKMTKMVWRPVSLPFTWNVLTIDFSKGGMVGPCMVGISFWHNVRPRYATGNLWRGIPHSAENRWSWFGNMFLCRLLEMC